MFFVSFLLICSIHDVSFLIKLSTFIFEIFTTTHLLEHCGFQSANLTLLEFCELLNTDTSFVGVLVDQLVSVKLFVTLRHQTEI
jgi:hypothetical protein